MLRSPRGRDWLCLFLLLLVPVVANWPVITGWVTVDPLDISGIVRGFVQAHRGIPELDPNVGLTTQALGRLAARQWLSGQIPWWNPYEGIGLPLSAEGQNPALFLPFVLLLALHNGPFLVKLALEEVAGLSTFLLLRRMGLGRVAAVMGGALFAVNGTFAWFGDAPIMPIAFLPLLLLGIETAWRIAQPPKDATGIGQRHPPGWAGWPLAAVAIALSLYAAFPETSYLDLLLGLLWALLRLGKCPRPARGRFFRHLVLAALTGLLLAMPFLLPFATLLHLGDLGMHAGGGITILHTPLPGLALLVMPTVLGPLGVIPQDMPNLAVTGLWNFMGGYVTLPVLCLALLALGGGGTGHRPLRLLLAGWCAAMIGASFGAPVITRLVYAMPMLDRVQIFRYSPGSWEFACAVLAALAVDDSRRGLGQPGRRLMVAALAALLILTVTCLLARPAFVLLDLGFAGYSKWLMPSVIGAAAVTGACLALLQLARRAFAAPLLAAIIAAQAMILYGVPLLSGATHETPVTGGISFLRQHLGLDRFYTFGPIRPNYPAYFGIAAINSDYLPAPWLWTRHIATALDPTSDPLTFSGQAQIPGAPIPDHAAALRQNIAAYRDLGVRYVVSSAGMEPLDELRLTPAVQPAMSFVPLAAGRSFDAAIPPAELQPGALRAVTVMLGTFGGRSQGPLTVTACAGAACEKGRGDLGMAGDNRPFEVVLSRPLAVPPGTLLRLHFSKEGPTPVALWLYRDQLTHQAAPGLGFVSAGGGVPHERVYQDGVMAIDAITGTAPYMQTTGGACDLRDMARDSVTATCAGPAVLIRRVLAYPGWRARVNGRSVPVTAYPPIFQAIPLPAGASRIWFHYAPPFAPAMEGAFFAGLLLLLWGCLWPPDRIRPNTA